MAPLVKAILSQLPTFVRLAGKIGEAWKKYKENKGVNNKPPTFRPRPLGAFILGVFMFAAAPAMAVGLAWDANTEPDLAGYRLYQATRPGGPYNFVQEFPRQAISGTQTLTADGLYYYVLTAFDTVGSESGFSNEVSYAETSFPPAAPQNLRLAP